MRYKLYYEPMYVYECKSILSNIVNGTSIRDDMEESIKSRGDSTRSSVEKLFQKSIALEKYMKKNICMNLLGYEETGQEMASFLFQKWEHADDAPIEAVYSYDLLLSVGIDNKAMMILYIIGLDFMVSVWKLKDIEAGTPPPFIDNCQFFKLINNSHLTQDEKLKALKLFYDFDSYRSYAHALLHHTEELLKNKISDYTDDINVHMAFAEEHWLVNDTFYVKNKINISTNDDLLYHVYPSIYLASTLVVNTAGFFEPYVIIGISLFSLELLYDKAESDNDKAIQCIKCLSDNTKLAILQLLKTKPLYGSQLAGKLNCTSANISQHMSTLLKLDMVHIKKENNRVYFHLNNDAIHNHLEIAKGLFR